MIEINNLTFSFNGLSKNILEDICFNIESNHCAAILGNNGAGKSTLLKCINRIYHMKSGSVAVNGISIHEMSRNELAQNIAYVSQKNNSIDMTVYDTIMLGRKPYINWDVKAADKKIVSDIIKQMHLEDFALRTVSRLSGGELQKVMLARALAQQPKLLLLDEPTSNLDPFNQHEVLSIVRDIAKKHNICVAIVIHDLNLAVRYCDRFAFLNDARLHSYGGVETMTPETIEEVYRIRVHISEFMGTPVIIPYP